MFSKLSIFQSLRIFILERNNKVALNKSLLTLLSFLFIMADTDIPFPLTLRKPETQTWGGGGMVGNLKFFHTKHIYKMVAIFQLFHNCQHQYSVFVNTQKTRDPHFGGVSNLKIFCTMYISEMVAIFQFFHNG